MSSPENELPFDFIEYLCKEHQIGRDSALELLAAGVRALSAPAPVDLDGLADAPLRPCEPLQQQVVTHGR